MTPAVQVLQKAKMAFTLHEYEHSPDAPSYGLEAAEKLGLDPDWVFKTLMVSLNDDPKSLAVAVVPVNAQLDLKALAKARKAKKAALADPTLAERATGYILGGISPLGQKRRWPMLLDSSAQALSTLYVSGGRRGLDIGLAPVDLQRLCQAEFAPIARR